jgi:predicted metal-dependent hydrolase
MTIENNTTTWSPHYTVRRSLKARRTFLQFTPTHGLEIVIPYKQRSVNIPKILSEKRHWIEKILIKNPKNFQQKAHPITHPNTIECLAIEETWKIVYQYSPLTAAVKLINLGSEKFLLLNGNTEDILVCKKVLTKWLIKKAHLHLIPWLKSLSLLTKLEFNRVIIRGQSTLWGSCNTQKTISLNYKLLFLPKNLVQHVLLHELCHTQHLNHSVAFWQLFKNCDPNCLENKKALKIADHYCPAWINVI